MKELTQFESLTVHGGFATASILPTVAAYCIPIIGSTGAYYAGVALANHVDADARKTPIIFASTFVGGILSSALAVEMLFWLA